MTKTAAENWASHYHRYPRLGVYTFRAMIDERGWNVDRKHEQHQGRYFAAGDRCSCYRLWDLNRKKTHHNIIRVIRGPRTFQILLGKKYRKIGWRNPKRYYT